MFGIKLNDKVSVETHDGIIISNNAYVTNISPCGNYIQTNLGTAYMPKNQVKKSNNGFIFNIKSLFKI